MELGPYMTSFLPCICCCCQKGHGKTLIILMVMHCGRHRMTPSRSSLWESKLATLHHFQSSVKVNFNEFLRLARN